MKKKILSFLLVFLMMVGFLPTNVYAAEDTADTVDIGNVTLTTYDELIQNLNNKGIADVTQDNSNGHINITLNKNIKGRLNFNIKGAYIVFDANGKTIDGSRKDEALCLEHSSAITMVLKGNGTYKSGNNYAIFAGNKNDSGQFCQFIILSAILEGSIGCNGPIKVKTQLQEGYTYYSATKNGQKLFDDQNKTERELTVATNHKDASERYVFEQQGLHTHDYTKQILTNDYLKSESTNNQEHDTYWYACSICDLSAQGDANAQDRFYQSEQYSNEWSYDENNHWHACTVINCTNKKDESNHDFGLASYSWSEDYTQCTATRKCKQCGYEFKETVDSTKEITQNQTCTTAEMTKFTAQFENNFFETQQIEMDTKNARGHEWSSEYTIDQKPTCTNDGSQSIHCKNCKATKDSKVINATGHSFSEWTITKESTLEETGKETRICSTCQYIEEKEIPTKKSVNVPTHQVGYSLEVDHSIVEESGSSTLTFKMEKGYSKTQDFVIRVNGEVIQLDQNNQYKINNIQENKTITVEGVADITAPNVKIEISNIYWKQLLNKITFGLFFKNNTTVNITASDEGSGVDCYYYYVDKSGSPTPLDEKQLQKVHWIEGKSVSLSDDKYVVYAKVIDYAGNIKYVSTDGIVIDSSAPQVSGVESGKTYTKSQTFTVTDANLDNVKVDGQVVELVNGQYTLVPKKGTYTIEVTDKACNKTTLNNITINQEKVIKPTISSKTYTGEKLTADIIESDLYKVVKNDGGIDAGEYEVQLTLKDPVNYKWEDGSDGTVTMKFIITKATPILTQPTSKSLTYNGSEQELINAASTYGGTVKYSLDNKTWSTTIPTGKDAKEYKVYYKVEGNKNFENLDVKDITCRIAPLAIDQGTVVLGKVLKYTGEKQTQEVESVLVDGMTLSKDDYEVLDNQATDEGVHILTIKAKGNNYTGLFKYNYVILPVENEQIGTGSFTVKTTDGVEINRDDLIDLLIENKIITANELSEVSQGKKIEIVLDVKDVQDSETIDSNIKGYNKVKYLDITLYKNVDGINESIHELYKGLKVTISLTEDLKNKDSNVKREYFVARNHNGKVDILEAQYDEKLNTITFETDRFSEYAIIYKDTNLQTPKKEQTKQETGNPNTKEENKEIINTGDNTNIITFMLVLVGSILVMAFIKKRQSHN